MINIKNYSKTLSTLLLAAMLLLLAHSVFAQTLTPASAEGEIEGESRETIIGPAWVKIFNDDGVLVDEKHLEAGGSYEITNKEKGRVEVSFSIDPSTGILDVSGTTDPSKSSLTFNFEGATKDEWGIESVTVPEDIAFEFAFQLDNVDDPKSATLISADSTIKLPSIQILDGKAETGLMTITLDPNVPLTGEIDLVTGEYSASYGLLLDMENVQQFSGEALKVQESVNGVIGAKLLRQVTGKGGISTTMIIILIVVAVIVLWFLFGRKRSSK